MTNPDSTVGTNAGYNGRTTPNAFNDILASYTRGLVSGWKCTPKSGMTVQLGGNGTTRDVAIAEDNAGNKTTINNRTATPVAITLDGAPSTGNRIDSIVAYVENPQNGAGASDVDFPSQVGIIAVKGTAAGTPTAPNEATIRTAITADGGNGASAYYVILANITVGQGVTTIGSGVITAGASAILGSPISNSSIGTSAISAGNINWANIGSKVVTNSTQTNIAQAGTTICTMSLGAGTYALIGVISHGHDNNSSADYANTLIKNGAATIAFGQAYLSSYWNSQNVVAVGTVTLSGTTSLTLVGSTANGNTDHTVGTSALVAIRIA